MRELALTAIVVVLCGVAVVKPRIGLYGYLWYALMRPDVLAWVEGQHPYSLFLAIATCLGSLRFIPDGIVWIRNPICRGLLLLQVTVAASVLFAVEPALCYEPYSLYLRAVIMSLLIPLLIRSERDLRDLFLVVTLSLGFLLSRMGAYGILHGGVRFAQGYGGMLSGNNELGAAAVIVLPLCWYCRELVASRWLKAAFVAMTGAVAAAAVMTYSRGAALGLAVVLLVILYRAKRRLGILLLLLLMTVPAVLLVKDTYIERLATLTDPTQEISAVSRIEQAKAAVAMWKDYPVFGVGFGHENYVKLSPPYLERPNFHVVHNSYLQTLVDSGIVAFLIYVALLFGSIIWLGTTARSLRDDPPQRKAYALALQASLTGFAVCSTFGSREGLDIYFILLMVAASLHTVRETWKSEELHPTEVGDQIWAEAAE